jgi:uncharacterized glyoxalase superfamily protein PhnB
MTDAHPHPHPHEHNHDHSHAHQHPPPAAPGARPQFTSAKPILNVASVARSLDYYRDRLGFSVNYAWSESEQFDNPAEPTFAEVGRGRLTLMLGQAEQPGPAMAVYADLHGLAALDSLYHEYTHSGADIASPPEDKPWGMREMLVRDPDGHILRIGAPVG